MTDARPPKPARLVYINLAVALAYLAGGMLMAWLSNGLGSTLILCVPNGIALGVYLIHSYRVVPGIWLGALAYTFWSLPADALPLWEGIILSGLVAGGPVFQAWLGRELMHEWMRVDTPLDGIREVLVFIFGVACVSALAYPTVATAFLTLADVDPGYQFGSLWAARWMGSVLGIIIVTPCFLVFRKKYLWKLTTPQKQEAIALAVVFGIVGEIVYGPWLPDNDYPLVYLLFPVLVWAALRFKQQGAVVATLLTALAAVWGTAEGRGPMGHKPEDTAQVLVQLYLFVLAGMSLTLGATVSKSHRMESEAERFGHILEHSINEIYMVDLETMKLVQVNEGVCKKLGYSMEELKQMSPLDFVYGYTPRQFGELLKKVAQHPEKEMVVESAQQCKDGSIYPVEAHLSIARFGERLYLVAIVMDITEKKKAQEEIVNARVRAEEANQAKSMFISSMSHEIRTPMNAILGYVQILERDQKLDGPQRKKVEGIQKAGNHLLGLINDILDFSKIEAGKMELSPVQFSLPGLVGDLKVIFKNRCDKNGLSLKVDVNFDDKGRWVEGDQGKLRQVLINLLENAVKFTDRGEVLFRVSQEADDQYLFEVIDTGCGIPVEKQAQVFEHFTQFEEGSRRGGTGLGLAISKKQVELMGGQMKLESDPGWGSRFYFSLNLPVTEELRQEDLREYDGVVALAPDQHVRALVVDDNHSNVEVLTETLTAVGVECQTVFSGWDAVDRALSWKPDVIFMDYRMPGLNGLEAAKMIQKNLNSDRTKIIMVTAASYRHQKEKFLQEGAHGFVAKPFLREAVLKVLRDLLKIDYVYHLEGKKEKEEAGEETLTQRFDTVPIPEPLLVNLKQSARLGMMTQLEEYLEEVQKLKPHGAQLANHLRTLADNFDKQGIMKVLETCKPQAST